MGYYVDFDFDLTISAEKVEAAEKAMIESLGEDNLISKERDFCTLFNDAWGETLAEEAPVSPLVALASGATRGEITIGGGVHKKWREWEEPLMVDALAPFIEAGGTVTVKGEDYDTPSEWRYDGAICEIIDFQLIAPNDRRELEAKAEAYDKLVAFLTETRDEYYKGGKTVADHMRRWLRVEKYLDKSPLEQLAEVAE